MTLNSSIEWTGSTWNPVTGCTKISPGYRHCYAERIALRLRAMGQPNYAQGFKVVVHENALEIPLQWRKPQTVFVNSMSDLFHESVPFDFISQVFEMMNRASWHVFQILTKRSERLLELSPLLSWKPNIWMGVSVETQDYLKRIHDLVKTRAEIKFVSFEPLLGSIPKLDLAGVDWAIVGGESGPAARPMQPSWVLEIRDQCQRAEVPFFFKQWGGVNKRRAGRLLEGQTWDEYPEPLNSSLHETSQQGRLELIV